MKNLPRIIFMALIVIIVGASIFLVTWNIPAPVSQVEKVINNDRFKN